MFKLFVYLNLLLILDVALCKPDYIYSYEAGGWMKLHVIPATWQDAFRKCHYEGAVLASPLNIQLTNALLAVLRNSNIDSHIHLGTHSLYNDGDFFSVEGVPLGDMYIKWGLEGWAGDGKCLRMSNDRQVNMYISDCTHRRPFICYKKPEDDLKVNDCGTFDDDYRFNKRTRRCYKVHTEIKTWAQAFEICSAEGGNLVIINDEIEAAVIKAMFPNGTKPSEWDRMLIGLRDLFEDQMWLTIHGERMEDVYHNWAPQQPDNQQGRQVCGNLYRNGGLDDNYCELKYIFVCEKDPKTTRYADFYPNIDYEQRVSGEQNSNRPAKHDDDSRRLRQ